MNGWRDEDERENEEREERKEEGKRTMHVNSDTKRKRPKIIIITNEEGTGREERDGNGRGGIEKEENESITHATKQRDEESTCNPQAPTAVKMEELGIDRTAIAEGKYEWARDTRSACVVALRKNAQKDTEKKG